MSSVFALLLMLVAVLFCFILTFDLSFFNSGPSNREKLLYFTVVPFGAGAGKALIAWAFGNGRRRIVASVSVAFLLAVYWVSGGGPMSLSGNGLSTQSYLLLTPALCAIIATVRRPEVSRSRAVVIYMLAAVAGIVGTLLIEADFDETSSLAASIAAWILLPTVTSVARSSPARETRENRGGSSL